MPIVRSKSATQEKGIWKYADFYRESIEAKNRLILGDGNTREVENEAINRLTGGKIYFKREDENETESLKGRSLAYQISLAKQNGQKELVISTSGNAGIAAAAYCQKAGIKLYIFISPDTEKEKIASMQKYAPVIIKSKNAIRFANYLAAKKKIRNLRPSRDESSIEGFKSISFEIFEHLGEVDALFTFVTSGSSFMGIGRGYEKLLKNNEIRTMPRLFAIQSGNVFSIAREFDKIENAHSNTSCAGSFGVRETRRKQDVVDLIRKSGGLSFYINNEEIKAAENILSAQEIFTSPEGCASFAGILRWSKTNKFEKAVCILSGKKRSPVAKIDEKKIYCAKSFEEMDELLFQ